MASDPNIADSDYIARAQARYRRQGAVKIADNAEVSRNDSPDQDHGAYVQAWVWVADPAPAYNFRALRELVYESELADEFHQLCHEVGDMKACERLFKKVLTSPELSARYRDYCRKRSRADEARAILIKPQPPSKGRIGGIEI